MDINWYPGHMAKTKRILKESLSMVDIVIELADARIPLSSRNPDLNALCSNKPRVIALNKSDLADPAVNKLWRACFTDKASPCVFSNSVTGEGFAEISKASARLMQEKKERQSARGRHGAPVRAMVVGIPNIGKSTFINKYAGRSLLKAEDRPGVTRQKQWIRLGDIMLLDTPGILYPNLGSEDVGVKLAVTGAIKDTITDTETLSYNLIRLILKYKPRALINRYGIEITPCDTAQTILERIAKKRGFLKKGGSVDTERAAVIVIDEFRGGVIGRISLETPN